MKTLVKATVAAITLSALMAGPALANVTNGDVAEEIRSVISSGSNVTVFVNDNTATLTGYFVGHDEKADAITTAKANQDIDRVIDLTTITR